MKKMIFNAIGIQSLQTELYALKDELLFMEATAANTDFRNWMKSRFDFSPPQIDYLDKLSSDFIYYTSQRVSFALAHRLPIYFNYANFDKRNSGIEKIIRSSDQTFFSSDGTARGSLSFDVSYKLVTAYSSFTRVLVDDE